jgi:hypothetical protein
MNSNFGLAMIGAITRNTDTTNTIIGMMMGTY